MNLEPFLATITVDHFRTMQAKATVLALAEQVSYCKLRLASCGIASVPPPRHQHPRCFHCTFTANYDLLNPPCYPRSARSDHSGRGNTRGYTRSTMQYRLWRLDLLVHGSLAQPLIFQLRSLCSSVPLTISVSSALLSPWSSLVCSQNLLAQNLAETEKQTLWLGKHRVTETPELESRGQARLRQSSETTVVSRVYIVDLVASSVATATMYWLGGPSRACVEGEVGSGLLWHCTAISTNIHDSSHLAEASQRFF